MATVQIDSDLRAENGRSTLELEGVTRRHRDVADGSRAVVDSKGEITAEANRLEDRVGDFNRGTRDLAEV